MSELCICIVFINAADFFALVCRFEIVDIYFKKRHKIAALDKQLNDNILEMEMQLNLIAPKLFETRFYLKRQQKFGMVTISSKLIKYPIIA